LQIPEGSVLAFDRGDLLEDNAKLPYSWRFGLLTRMRLNSPMMHTSSRVRVIERFLMRMRLGWCHGGMRFILLS